MYCLIGTILNLKKLTPLEVIFYIGGKQFAVSVTIVELNKILKRTFLSNLLSYGGPSLAIDNAALEYGRQTHIIIKMDQKIKSERDKLAKCMNYPNEKFLNYNDCDQSFVDEYFKTNFNLTPFWTSDDLNAVTQLKNDFDKDCIDRYYHTRFYFRGTLETPCYIPCLTTKVSVGVVIKMGMFFCSIFFLDIWSNCK